MLFKVNIYICLSLGSMGITGESTTGALFWKSLPPLDRHKGPPSPPPQPPSTPASALAFSLQSFLSTISPQPPWPKSIPPPLIISAPPIPRCRIFLENQSQKQKISDQCLLCRWKWAGERFWSPASASECERQCWWWAAAAELSSGGWESASQCEDAGREAPHLGTHFQGEGERETSRWIFHSC